MNSESAATLDDVARHFEVHRRTVMEWKRSGCPCEKSAEGYDLQAISTWRTLNRTPKEKDSSDEGLQRRMLVAEVEKKEAEAALKQHEKLKKTEDVVHLDDVERFLSLLFSSGRRKLLRIPEEMAPGYPSNIRDILRDDLEERLKLWLKSMASSARDLSDLRSS